MNSKMQKEKYHGAEATLNEIDVNQHVWNTMSDGNRQSAKIWLPRNADKNAVPAILEIIPYRKRDAYSIRDHSNHSWLAKRGYVCIRPDMRGHGDSEGRPPGRADRTGGRVPGAPPLRGHFWTVASPNGRCRSGRVRGQSRTAGSGTG